jgi:hypothetical protein
MFTFFFFLRMQFDTSPDDSDKAAGNPSLPVRFVWSLGLCITLSTISVLFHQLRVVTLYCVVFGTYKNGPVHQVSASLKLEGSQDLPCPLLQGNSWLGTSVASGLSEPCFSVGNTLAVVHLISYPNV